MEDLIAHPVVAEILAFTEELNRYKDVDTILDRILFKSRELSGADAGTIYLVENGALRFSYVQNETLFSEPECRSHVYSNVALPMDESSIVGYVAVTRETLDIANAYDIDGEFPFCFNPRFDEETGYRTVSLLTVPLIAAGEQLVGVLQLINARDGAGNVTAFSRESKAYLPLLTTTAAATIERGAMTRELILRMMRMAELHDPTETGPHVMRVGAYAGEIYRHWAIEHDIPPDEARHFRDLLRVTAMLHDVGKVGISDIILKKPGRLDHDEYTVMKLHTVFGARLFANTTSEMDEMAANITLNHHERWDGKGYPGFLDDITADELCVGAGKKGEEIPLEARIVALADVFDALSSKRAYKDAWSADRVLALIEEESGGQFDPSVVRSFFAVKDVLRAVQKRYSSGSADIEQLSLEARIACSRIG